MKLHNEYKDFVKDEFVQWLNTRCKYAKSVPLGVLASLQPSKNGVERDYANNPLCVAFNASIMLQKELLGLEHYRAFLLVYFGADATRYYRDIGEPIINVKSHAMAIGVSVQAIYDMAHKFVLVSYTSATSNNLFNERLRNMVGNNNFTF